MYKFVDDDGENLIDVSICSASTQPSIGAMIRHQNVCTGLNNDFGGFSIYLGPLQIFLGVKKWLRREIPWMAKIYQIDANFGLNFRCRDGHFLDYLPTYLFDTNANSMPS